jgi:hypothetical protein
VNNNAKMIAFGKEYGNETDYGHVEILMGKNAEKEVYPEILKWLNSIEANIETHMVIAKVRFTSAPLN